MRFVTRKILLPLAALAAVALSSGSASGANDPPANDASFAVEVEIDGAGVALESLPPGLGGPGSDPRGVFIEDGKVIEQSREERGQAGSECVVAWGICDYYRTVTGSYGNGHLEIEIESRTDVTFNGLPAVPGGTPTQPGTINLVDTTQIKVDFNPETTDTFAGEAVLSDQWFDWGCAQWEDSDGDGDIDSHDEGGVCLLDKYTANAPEVTKAKAFAWVRGAVGASGGGGEGAAETAAPATSTPSPTPLTVGVLKLEGDVVYIPAGQTESRPLTPDIVLQKGDTISCGFESRGHFRIGNREFVVSQVSSVRIDDFFEEGKIEKTILFLKIGALAVKERHTNSTRSDFSVTTPISNSSPRGTEFVVTVGEDGGTTTYVMDGTVAFSDAAGASVDITPGNKASAPAGGGIAGPSPYTDEEIAGLPSFPSSGASSPSRAVIAGALALAIVVLGGIVLLRRRVPAPQPA
jgi:hypothetical protein